MKRSTALFFLDSLKSNKVAYLEREEAWRLLVVSFLRDLAFYQLHKNLTFPVNVFSPMVSFLLHTQDDWASS